MGEFSFTCALSGLPIEGGDRVRAFLITSSPYGGESGTSPWSVRSLPIRATYNNYGSIEDAEEGPVRDTWLKALGLDMVERGVGDNSFHDVPTHKLMNWEQLLRALAEDRLQVVREYDPYPPASRKARKDRAAEADVTRPTLAKVQALLDQQGHPKFSSYGTPGFMVDELDEGWVRVRHHGIFGAAEEELRKLLPLFEPYATMIASGSGPYPDSAEILLRPKPGRSAHAGGLRKDTGPLDVRLAMVREDVWQEFALGKFTIKHWSPKALTVQAYRDEVRALSKNLTYVYQQPIFTSKSDHLTDWMFKTEIPFSVGTGDHIRLMLEGGSLADSVCDTIGEFAFIMSYMRTVRHTWYPSTSNGPQYGEWGEHAKFQQAMQRVTKAKLKELSAERRASRKREREWETTQRTMRNQLRAARLNSASLPADELDAERSVKLYERALGMLKDSSYDTADVWLHDYKEEVYKTSKAHTMNGLHGGYPDSVVACLVGVNPTTNYPDSMPYALFITDQTSSVLWERVKNNSRYVKVPYKDVRDVIEKGIKQKLTKARRFLATQARRDAKADASMAKT